MLTKKSTGFRHPEKILKAKGVVFSASVLGTVKLLNQCKQNGMLPNISDQLGNYVRTNSEALLAVKSRNKSVNWNDQIAITSGIYADETTHIEMVRYNKGSDVLLNLLTVMTGGGGKIPRVIPVFRQYPPSSLAVPVPALAPGKSRHNHRCPGDADG